MTRLSTPAAGPAWLPRYTASIERALGGHLVSGGAVSSAVTAISASAAIGSDGFFFSVDASGGAVTLTLPPAAGNEGRQLVVKKVDSSGNAVTIDGNASETIDGAATLAITLQYQAYALICDGTEWWVL